jgi:hypothetical protein
MIIIESLLYGVIFIIFRRKPKVGCHLKMADEICSIENALLTRVAL